MGSAASCKTFCPNSHSNEIEITGPLTPIKPLELKEISLEPADKGSEISLAKDLGVGEVIEHFNADKSPIKQKVNDNEELWLGTGEPTEQPGSVEPSYVQNHIVVPFEIIQSKLHDEVKLLLKKELPKCPLLQSQSMWYLLPSGNYFSGQMKDGQPSNQGTYLLANGDVYSGMTQDGRPDGIGVLVQKFSVYKGEFFRGDAKGKARYQTNDIIAEGTWASGFMTHGKIITNKYSYQGELSHGKPSGDGVYKDIEKEIVYHGKFVDGEFDCYSICPVRSENKDDIRNCKTVYQCPSFTYEGPLKAGMRNGEGTMKYKKGQQVVVKHGVWLADTFQSR